MQRAACRPLCLLVDATVGKHLLCCQNYLQVVDVHNQRPFTVHKCPVPILSMAASSTGSVVAVGMADGAVSIQRQRKHAPTEEDETARLRSVSARCSTNQAPNS